ncbi:putative deoxyribonuclease TATDN1 [Babesia sp. Xinjiang]|uniref:putative deoxyribonuclease TATDN1 n=1 Tax=Babesia sp. Xinjiang TaxID=462227 RepID=UPI000A257F85|nr:putative deoxyribonuclease TATDN1 [Babesia sp. Xinjiang]XP_028871479.1 putative deoxyribonuclease TATDN1 [Babesia sp. Xinjiang]ORM41008.1 putative deoxyribonuclease TATDN1 [Babesia sp. Xinjiang]ORM41023.1 putative deoxyribonuclease TATDN1 [Babesia sp. Xinjiang]
MVDPSKGPSAYTFIDIGANLVDEMYKGLYNGKPRHIPDLPKVIERAQNIGVKKMVLTAGTLGEVHEALDICKEYDKAGIALYTTAGVHPTMCNEFINNKFNKTPQQYIEALDELITTNKDRIVAIGELGLDYDRLPWCDKEIQKKYFEMQLDLAAKHKLPLFLHMRNATDDTMDILIRNKEKWIEGGAVCHSFTSDEASLQRVIDLGIYVGINGCSLKTTENLGVLKKVPLDKIMLETDCPWCGIKPTHASIQYVKTTFPVVKKAERMTGDTIFNQRSEPCLIIQVAEVVHQIVAPDMDFTQFCDTIYNNTVALFKGIA